MLFIKKMILLLMGFVLLVSPNLADAATKKKKAKPYVAPYAHIVIDANSHKVLSQSDADRSLYPASLTKVMTLVLVFENLDAGKITLKSSIPMTTHAARMPPSKIGLKPGQTISVENAIKALVTKSANDIAAAVGEKIGGSEQRFAQLMNLKARQIGMTQTHFVNASGLHNARQVSSARDMAKLAAHVMRTYPHYYHYFSLKQFSFNGTIYRSHNRLMNTYFGMDGLKTGYISQSGFNLVASAKRGNTRLIGVVLGGKTANGRNEQMAKLLDEGFKRRNFNLQQQTPPIQPYAPPAPPSVAVSEIPPEMPPKMPMKTLTVPTAADWAVQIGAFQNQTATDTALSRALQSLPAPLNKGNPMIVPLRTSQATWVFRARIGGYTREQAVQVCRHLDDCLTISPQAK